MISELNKYGICLEPTKKYKILDDIGQHFLDQIAELVKSGHTFVYVLDNIDWEEKVHDTRTDAQNQSVHAVATSIVVNRVSSAALPDSGPQQDLKSCNVHKVISLSEKELKEVRSRYKVIIAQILFKYFTAFQMFDQYTPQDTECCYADEMAVKSDVITMPVLMKDEKKYAEVVDILDELEKWTKEIYTAAGLCPHKTAADDTTQPLIGSTSRPDQPGSHVRPTESEDDPLSGVKIPCFGDQLNRVGLAGATALRAGCHSTEQRIGHLYPFCIVDWHTKRSYLKVQYTIDS